MAATPAPGRAPAPARSRRRPGAAVARLKGARGAVDDLNMARQRHSPGVMGAIVGSFLNVVAYRLPRKESLVKPGSHCPAAARRSSPTTTSRCSRGCCCAATAAAAASRSRCATRSSRRSRPCCAWAPSWSTTRPSSIALSILVILLVVPAALIDLEYRIIPNRMTAFGAIARAGDRHRARPRRRARTPDRGRGGGWLPAARGARLSRPAWAWATSSSPASSACSSARPSLRRCSSRSSRGSSSARS